VNTFDNWGEGGSLALRELPTCKLKILSAPVPAVDAKVLIVDHDTSGLQSTASLVAAAEYRPIAVGSATDLLTSLHLRPPCCVILEMNLGEINGLDVQHQLKRLSPFIPVIFLTAFPSIENGIAAMKAGAVDYLVKPVGLAEISAAVTAALLHQARRLELDCHLAKYKEGFGRLTPREREVFRLIVEGMLNKQVAARLGTSEKTIKVHRGRVMPKMGAGSFAELVQMAERATFSATLQSIETETDCRPAEIAPVAGSFVEVAALGK
jgi:FixJ family two-component response regulator